LVGQIVSDPQLGCEAGPSEVLEVVSSNTGVGVSVGGGVTVNDDPGVGVSLVGSTGTSVPVGSTGMMIVGDTVPVSIAVGAGVSTGCVGVGSGVVVTTGVFDGVGLRPPASTGEAQSAKPKITKNITKNFFTFTSKSSGRGEFRNQTLLT